MADAAREKRDEAKARDRERERPRETRITATAERPRGRDRERDRRVAIFLLLLLNHLNLCTRGALKAVCFIPVSSASSRIQGKLACLT